MAGLVELMRGFVVAKTLALVAEVGVADLIVDGVHDVHELARRTGSDRDALERVMRALCGLDVFRERERGVFDLGPLGTELVDDDPASLRNWIRMNGGTIFRAFADAEIALRTGRPAVEAQHGEAFFSHLERNPAEAAVFDAAMRDFSRRANAGLLASYDFTGVGTLVDVGGGSGILLADVLRSHERLRGILFERPDVVERARSALDEAGVAERVEVVAGDFFAAVAPGGDAYVLSWILHDWRDPEALAILSACRRAMRVGAKLLVLEAVLPDTDEPHFARFGDVVMLVALGGRERTLSEYEALLAQAGFSLTRMIETGSPRSILEAVAVEHG